MTDDAQQQPKASPEQVAQALQQVGGDGQVDVSKPAKLIRLGSMVREMLEELRRAPVDEKGRERIRDIHDKSIEAVREILSPELQEEFSDLSVPFSDAVPTESELRIAQAQLMGWLEGLFHGIQAALWAQHVAAQQQATQFARRMPAGQQEPPKSGYL